MDWEEFFTEFYAFLREKQGENSWLPDDWQNKPWPESPAAKRGNTTASEKEVGFQRAVMKLLPPNDSENGGFSGEFLEKTYEELRIQELFNILTKRVFCIPGYEDKEGFFGCDKGEAISLSGFDFLNYLTEVVDDFTGFTIEDAFTLLHGFDLEALPKAMAFIYLRLIRTDKLYTNREDLKKDIDKFLTVEMGPESSFVEEQSIMLWEDFFDILNQKDVFGFELDADLAKKIKSILQTYGAGDYKNNEKGREHAEPKKPLLDFFTGERTFSLTVVDQKGSWGEKEKKYEITNLSFAQWREIMSEAGFNDDEMISCLKNVGLELLPRAVCFLALHCMNSPSINKSQGSRKNRKEGGNDDFVRAFQAQVVKQWLFEDFDYVSSDTAIDELTCLMDELFLDGSKSIFRKIKTYLIDCLNEISKSMAAKQNREDIQGTLNEFDKKECNKDLTFSEFVSEYYLDPVEDLDTLDKKNYKDHFNQVSKELYKRITDSGLQKIDVTKIVSEVLGVKRPFDDKLAPLQEFAGKVGQLVLRDECVVQ